MGLFLIPGAIQSAWAQTGEAGGEAGAMRAVAYREVPERLALSVAQFDDSDLDLEIRDLAVAALAEASHDVRDGSPFVLELVSEVHAGGSAGADPSLGRLSSNENDTQFEMNIWSSSQDSILGGRHSDGAARTASTFEIRASLRERSLGDVVWEGRAVVRAERDQAEPYLAAMVESLVQSLGRTVRDETFPVP